MPNRRSFLKIGGAAAVVSVSGGFARLCADSSPTLTRFDAASTEGKAMLAKLASAVDAMVQKPESHPFNWVSWWYTHAVRPDRNKADEVRRIFQGLPPQASEIANRTWDTCQNHHPGGVEDLFLPWHRFFVYSFERVVRSVLSDQTFTLPYWNYTNPSNRAIPAETRNQSDPVLTALFRPTRNNGINQGSAIDAGLSPSPINLDDLKYDDYSSFCESLDLALHGTVHVRVGNGRGMGVVEWAGNDPVFWLHHCNIDRLWASWNKGGGQNLATQEFLDHTFPFVGPDGTLATFKVRDCLDIAQLQYQYATLEQRPARRVTNPIAAFTSAAPSVRAANVQLGAAPTKVVLKRDSTSSGVATFSGAISSAGSVALILKGLQTNLQPESLYEVFVNLPDHAGSRDRQRYYAGRINFFESRSQSDNLRKFVLDVSNLRDILKASSEPTVTILPTDTPSAEAKPVIGEIVLATLR